MAEQQPPAVTVEGYEVDVTKLGLSLDPPYLLLVGGDYATYKYVLKKKESTLWEKWLGVPDGSVVEVKTNDSNRNHVGYKTSGDGGGLTIGASEQWPDWYVEEVNLESFTVLREAD